VSGLENQRKTSDLRGTMIMPVMLGAMSSRVQSDGPLSDIHQTISGTIVLSRKQDAFIGNELSELSQRSWQRHRMTIFPIFRLRV
jgi:hypothetical protein